MGMRTVALLINDIAHEWQDDNYLGTKIMVKSVSRNEGFPFLYGDVLPYEHADTTSLVLIDGYNMKVVAQSHYKPKEPIEVALLREMADKLGYRIVKKSKPKE